MTDPQQALLHSPSACRNSAAIAQILAPALPAQGLILEVASGSGQHVEVFSKLHSALIWQPSDPDAASRDSICARIQLEGLANVRAPLDLDVVRQPWSLTQADGVVCINMIHISAWSAAQALFAGAQKIVPAGGFVFLYGPYLQTGVDTAAGNLAFDASLRSRDPAWGIRHLDDVAALAHDCGFDAPQITPMPANNLSVLFERR